MENVQVYTVVLSTRKRKVFLQYISIQIYLIVQNKILLSVLKQSAENLHTLHYVLVVLYLAVIIYASIMIDIFPVTVSSCNDIDGNRYAIGDTWVSNHGRLLCTQNGVHFETGLSKLYHGSFVNIYIYIYIYMVQ